MILYFADRRMNILGSASTELPEGLTIVDDVKIDEVDTGVATFECSIAFDAETRESAEKYTSVGNYLLRSYNGENGFFTIIDSELDTKAQEIQIYAEDAGLDLLNEICVAYEADKDYPISHYIEKFAYDSGFVIGINEASDLSRKLKWEGESTAAERLASVATQFDNCEISYSFEIKGLTVVKKYINIYKERGSETGVQLRLNKEVDRITEKKSIANLATALKVTGGTPEADAEGETVADPKPITLDGYTYDDGDIFLEGTYLKSRSAHAIWSRYLAEDGDYTGHIMRTFTYNTTSQSELCSRAVAELKKISQVEVNYEAEVHELPEHIRIGDRVCIIDDTGEIYVSTRILKLEESATNESRKATFGEFLMKDSGIDADVVRLAAQFADNAKSTTYALSVAKDAKTVASSAVTDVANAKAAADAAQETANTAKQSAEAAATAASNAQSAVDAVDENVSSLETTVSNAQAAADQAKQAAENAEKVATNFLSYDATDGLQIGNKSSGSWSGYRTQMKSDSFNILDSNGNMLASYGANDVYLGANNQNTIIHMCNDLGTIQYNTSLESIDIKASKLTLASGVLETELAGKIQSYIDIYDQVIHICCYNPDDVLDNSNILIDKSAMTLTGQNFIGMRAPYVDIQGDLEVSGKASADSSSVTWIKGRDGASFKSSVAPPDTSSYMPLTSVKSSSGSWEMGTLNDKLYFSYATDSDYNAGTNTTVKSGFNKDGSLFLNGQNFVETGTWTPVLVNESGSAPTYTTGWSYAYYIKIGKLVFISVDMAVGISNKGGSYAKISGLPYTCGSVMCALNSNETYQIIDMASGDLKATFRVMANTKTIRILTPNGSNSYSWKVNTSAGTNAGRLRFSGVYGTDI